MGSAFQVGDEGVQVLRGGVGVEHGGLEPEAAVGGGAAEDGGAVVEEGAAQGGEVVVVRGGGSEEDRGEGGGCVEFEAGVCVEEVGEPVGCGGGEVDEVGEAVAAE